MKSTPTKRCWSCVKVCKWFLSSSCWKNDMELAGFESGSQGTESPVTQQPQSQQLMEMSKHSIWQSSVEKMMFTNEVTLKTTFTWKSPLGFILLPMDWIFVGARCIPCTRHEQGLKSEPHSKYLWGARRDEDLTVCFWRENRNARNKENHTQQILRHPQIAKYCLGNGNRTTALGSLYIDQRPIWRNYSNVPRQLNQPCQVLLKLVQVQLS